MEARRYSETGGRLGFHLAVGAGMVLLPLAAGLGGLLTLVFAAGLPVLGLGLWAAGKRLLHLHEYVEVSDEEVAYVNPLRPSRAVRIPLERLRHAQVREKPFGMGGRKKEMAAVLLVEGGRKLTLTERFLPADQLEALVSDVVERSQRLGLAVRFGPGEEDGGEAAAGAAGAAGEAGGPEGEEAP